MTVRSQIANRNGTQPDHALRLRPQRNPKSRRCLSSNDCKPCDDKPRKRRLKKPTARAGGWQCKRCARPCPRNPETGARTPGARQLLCPARRRQTCPAPRHSPPCTARRAHWPAACGRCSTCAGFWRRQSIRTSTPPRCTSHPTIHDGAFIQSQNVMNVMDPPNHKINFFRFPQNVIPQFVPKQKKLNPILKCYLHDRFLYKNDERRTR